MFCFAFVNEVRRDVPPPPLFKWGGAQMKHVQMWRGFRCERCDLIVESFDQTHVNHITSGLRFSSKVEAELSKLEAEPKRIFHLVY